MPGKSPASTCPKPPACTCPTPPTMIGIKTMPDTKYITKDRVKDVNDLITSMQKTACLLEPDDKQLEEMLDKIKFPLECKELRKNISNAHDFATAWSKKLPPDQQVWEEIFRNAEALARSVLYEPCRKNDGKITRSEYKNITKASLDALCASSRSR